MALTDENGGTGMVMPVSPMYGGNNSGFGGFGGDWGWIILLLLFAGGGWGMGGGFGGYGNMMLGYDFPWLLNGQNGINNNVSDGFRTAQLQDSITSVRDGISGLSTQLCGCCGDMQMSMANGFSGVNATITGAQNAITSQMYNNEIASLNRSFAEQTANTQGFTNVNSGIADLRYTEATEACATRTAAAQNTRDIIDSQTRGTQAILDKLCQLELDGVKGQLAQAQRENVGLQNQLNMANLATSQTAQTAQIVDQTYNRLSQCPVGTTPVYGNTPIFTCNNGCGCSGSNF